jgi:hypothetical protein
MSEEQPGPPSNNLDYDSNDTVVFHNEIDQSNVNGQDNKEIFINLPDRKDVRDWYEICANIPDEKDVRDWYKMCVNFSYPEELENYFSTYIFYYNIVGPSTVLLILALIIFIPCLVEYLKNTDTPTDNIYHGFLATCAIAGTLFIMIFPSSIRMCIINNRMRRKYPSKLIEMYWSKIHYNTFYDPL